MACEPKFEPAFSFECIMEIISDVRSGSVSTATVQKGLWIIGNGLASIGPRPIGPLGPTMQEVSDMPIEDICTSLETRYLVAGSEPSAAIDINTIMLIAQLVFKLLKNLKS